MARKPLKQTLAAEHAQAAQSKKKSNSMSAPGPTRQDDESQRLLKKETTFPPVSS